MDEWEKDKSGEETAPHQRSLVANRSWIRVVDSYDASVI